jgi:glyoxylase-like metal-dependent hydrolase (beta-lactamase superfamily II)
MIVETLEVGPFMENCYVLGCEKNKESVVIDPGDEVDRILRSINNNKLKVKYILNTHSHLDHVSGNKRLKELTSAPIMIHEKDADGLNRLSALGSLFGIRVDNSPPPDQYLYEGDIIRFGEFELKVIHTPGHSPGGASFYCQEEKKIFVGDTLFNLSIGRTDLPGGGYETLIKSVVEKIFPLGDDVEVYPGHGPKTTIGFERRHNPFFQDI